MAILQKGGVFPADTLLSIAKPTTFVMFFVSHFRAEGPMTTFLPSIENSVLIVLTR